MVIIRGGQLSWEAIAMRAIVRKAIVGGAIVWGAIIQGEIVQGAVVLEPYLEPKQASTMELFVNILNGSLFLQ